MEISSITATLVAISKAIDIAKNIKNTDAPLKKAEMELQFADLISELVDAKMETANIQQQLLEKDIQIQNLEEQISMKGLFQFEAPFYWKKIDGDEKDGPYCQACFDKHSEAIRLYQFADEWWECKACKNKYEKNIG